MSTATILNDQKSKQCTWIALQDGAYVGRKFYGVDTGDVSVGLDTVLGISGSGGVAVGTAFDAGHPTCLLRNAVPDEFFKDRIVYRLDYTQDSGGGSIDGTAVNTTAFHEVAESTAQQEITADIAIVAIKPTSRITPVNQLVVTGYRTGAQLATARAHWFSIRGKLNSGTVAIPGLLNVSGSNFTAQIKELLAMTMRVQPVQKDLVRVDYTFGFGPAGSGTFASPGTFQYVWQKEDEDGNPILTVLSDIYFTAAFTPGSLWG